MKKFRTLHICVMLIIIFIGLLTITQKANAIDVNDELYCLAQNIYFESGNQPKVGKVAVANTTMNRVANLSYPNTICKVVYQAKMKENWKGNLVPIRHMCQFSWYCDGKSDMPTDSATWMESIDIARLTIQGVFFDVTEGATHYHNHYVYPYWAEHLNETVVINDHTFYK